MITTNEHTLAASELMWRAEWLARSGYEPAAQAAALLAYFHVIETLSHIVRWEPPDDYEAQQTLVLTLLKKSLGSEKGLRKKAAAVRDAATNLDRLENRFASLRIDAAAQAFGLPAEWRNTVKRFAKFRNRSLGHPDTTASSRELEEWLRGPLTGTAPWLANRMLCAAVSYLRSAHSVPTRR